MSITMEFKTVQEYINAQPEETKAALNELRECIFKAAPDAIEMLNYSECPKVT